MLRRHFCKNSLFAGSAFAKLARGQEKQPAQPTQSGRPGQPAQDNVFLERPVSGQAHKGKVLLAVQAHSDDITLSAAGTVAKLIEEGYTGYWVRATNDDMGNEPGLGTVGTIGKCDLGNERDNAEIARILGCKQTFNLNYNNHRMADISVNELISRLILIIRLVKADTVVSWDHWAHDE